MPLDLVNRRGGRHVPSLEMGQLVEVGVRDPDGLRWYPSRLEECDDSGSRLAIAWPSGEKTEFIHLDPTEMVTLAISCEGDALCTDPGSVEALR